MVRYKAQQEQVVPQLLLMSEWEIVSQQKLNLLCTFSKRSVCDREKSKALKTTLYGCLSVCLTTNFRSNGSLASVTTVANDRPEFCSAEIKSSYQNKIGILDAKIKLIFVKFCLGAKPAVWRAFTLNSFNWRL